MWNLTCAAKSQIDKTGGNSIVAAQCRRRWKLLILFFFFIEFSTPWLNTVIGDETGLASQLILIHPFISHPVHEMLYYTTGVYALYSLRISTDCGVFYVPEESEQWKSCETAPMVFLPYPKRLKKTKMYNCLTICCRCHNKGITFSSVIGPAGDWTDNLFICSSQKEKNVIKHS